MGGATLLPSWGWPLTTNPKGPDRAPAGTVDFAKLTREPLARLSYSDLEANAGTNYAYAVRVTDRRGHASPLSAPVSASGWR